MNNKTILLIEDNPSDIELTRRALTKSRICNDLVVVEDGVDALEYLFCTGSFATRNCDEMPTLILLDCIFRELMA